MKLKTTSLIMTSALLTLSTVSAQADESILQVLKVLRDNGTITAEQYQSLEKTAVKTEATSTAASKSKYETKLKGGHLKIQSDDGAFSMKFGGRVMADYAFMHDSTEDKGGASHAYEGNSSEIRRARLFVKGQVFNDWGYKLQLDFAGNKTTLKDAYLRYEGLDNTNITLGNHKMPFGLNELTSSKYTTFMERSFVSEMFAPSRKNGLSIQTHGDNWTAGIGAHMDDIDDNHKNGENTGYVGRVTFAPIAEKTKSIHLGIGYDYENYDKYFADNDDGDLSVKIEEKPEVHTAGKFFKFKPLGKSNDFSVYNLEAAGVFGPFSAQAEYFDGSYGMDGAKDVDATGYYLFGSYFITGESRNYNAEAGEFGRVKPNSIVGQGGYGAFELAVRYSDADLKQGALGVKPQTTTIGLNWYATPTVRFMTNYVRAKTDVKGGEDFNAVQFRGPVDF